MRLFVLLVMNARSDVSCVCLSWSQKLWTNQRLQQYWLPLLFTKFYHVFARSVFGQVRCYLPCSKSPNLWCLTYLFGCSGIGPIQSQYPAFSLQKTQNLSERKNHVLIWPEVLFGWRWDVNGWRMPSCRFPVCTGTEWISSLTLCFAWKRNHQTNHSPVHAMPRNVTGASSKLQNHVW